MKLKHAKGIHDFNRALAINPSLFQVCCHWSLQYDTLVSSWSSRYGQLHNTPYRHLKCEISLLRTPLQYEQQTFQLVPRDQFFYESFCVRGLPVANVWIQCLKCLEDLELHYSVLVVNESKFWFHKYKSRYREEVTKSCENLKNSKGKFPFKLWHMSFNCSCSVIATVTESLWAYSCGNFETIKGEVLA